MLVAVKTHELTAWAVCCRRLALVVKSLAVHTHPSGADSPKLIVTVAAPVVPVHLNEPAQEPPPTLVTVAHAPVPVTPAVVPPDVGMVIIGVVRVGEVRDLFVSVCASVSPTMFPLGAVLPLWSCAFRFGITVVLVTTSGAVPVVTVEVIGEA